MHLTVAISDIHGCLAELLQLQSKVLEYAEEHGARLTWVFLGDYIDRGPDSAKVVRHIQDFQKRHDCHVLAGNHDLMMSDVLIGDQDGRTWSLNGMHTTLASYGHAKVLNEAQPFPVNLFNSIAVLRADAVAMDDARWLGTLPTSYEDQLRYYVHAGIRPGVALAEQSRRDQLWIRNEFIRHQHSHPKHVVHGHTPAPDGHPVLRANRTGLDTSCWSTGFLTAGIFNDGQAEPIGFLSTGFLRSIVDGVPYKTQAERERAQRFEAAKMAARDRRAAMSDAERMADDENNERLAAELDRLFDEAERDEAERRVIDAFGGADRLRDELDQLRKDGYTPFRIEDYLPKV